MYLAAKLLDCGVLHKRMDLCVMVLPKDDLWGCTKEIKNVT